MRLSIYPTQLFNRGLAEARNGRMSLARDLFAAVVYWCPKDTEARNALAMACLALGDRTEAEHHWNVIQEQSTRDIVAQQGLMILSQSRSSYQSKKRLALVSSIFVCCFIFFFKVFVKRTKRKEFN